MRCQAFSAIPAICYGEDGQMNFGVRLVGYVAGSRGLLGLYQVWGGTPLAV